MTDSIVDIGDNHAIWMKVYKGEVAALELSHPGCRSPSFIPFTGRAWATQFAGKIHSWEVVNESPLTLFPSLLCRVCGDHGFIREGKWVKA